MSSVHEYAQELLDALDQYEDTSGLTEEIWYAEDRVREAREKLTEALKPCQAVIFHGPGHQSKSPCILTGDHEIHTNDLGHRWREDAGFTDFFDESPIDD